MRKQASLSEEFSMYIRICCRHYCVNIFLLATLTKRSACNLPVLKLKDCTTLAVYGPAELTQDGPLEASEEPGNERYADPSTRSNKAVKRPLSSRFFSPWGVSNEHTCSNLRL